MSSFDETLMGRHTFETVKKEYLSSSIPLFLNSFWTLTLSLSGGETRIKRSLRVVVREEEEEEVNKALLVNTNNDGGRNAGRLVHDDAPPMGQNEDLVVDEARKSKTRNARRRSNGRGKCRKTRRV